MAVLVTDINLLDQVSDICVAAHTISCKSVNGMPLIALNPRPHT